MTDLKIRWRLHGDYIEPTTRQRGINIYNQLQSVGIDADAWDGKEAADIIVLQYTLNNLDAALATGASVIYDCNDMVFATHHASHSDVVNNIHRVNAVVAGSPRIAQHMARMHNTVQHIPEAIDNKYAAIKPKAHDGLNIIWMGMHDNIAYFQDIDAALTELSKEYEFTVVFMCPEVDGVGRSNRDKVKAKEYNGKFIPWSFEDVMEQMSIADIALTPLFQNEWCWCKCANKAASFMSAGIPTVAPVHPSYNECIEHGVSGMLAYSGDEWYDAIKQLLKSKTRRKNMSTAGKKRAMRLYNITSIGNQWINMFNRVRPV